MYYTKKNKHLPYFACLTKTKYGVWLVEEVHKSKYRYSNDHESWILLFSFTWVQVQKSLRQDRFSDFTLERMQSDQADLWTNHYCVSEQVLIYFPVSEQYCFYVVELKVSDMW